MGSAVLLLGAALMNVTDYKRAQQGLPPIFAMRTQMYKDGGTSIYVGIGYQVIDYNQADGRKDVVFRSLYVTLSSP